MAKASPKSNLTPMMQQYMEERGKLPKEALLFFRLGDFYEMFHEDAVTAHRVLGITLTERNGYPMAGVPYHAADGYISKALAAGMKVAICEQVETPKPGQIVRRRLTRLLTPGTMLEDHQVESNRGQYLLALDLTKQGLAAAWLDLTTGEFQLACEKRPEDLLPVFTSLDAREVIVAEQAQAEWKKQAENEEWLDDLSHFIDSRSASEIAPYHFERDTGKQAVQEALGVLNLEGFGVEQDHPALGAAGALVYYATESLCAKPENLCRISTYSSGKTLLLDPATLRNLEVFRDASGTRECSLLKAMDGTSTAAGARLLERFLAEPTLKLDELKRRQSCVGEFLAAPSFASELQEYLREVRDIPRGLGRLQNGLRNPRELGAIRATLEQIPFIARVTRAFEGLHLNALADRLNDLPELADLLKRALADELPSQLQDGGYIREGFDDELDRLRGLNADNKNWIADLEAGERQRTGIKSLRIKHNNAFGYFIEVTKSNAHLVPDNYIRKQTMVNAERFYTADLKEKEREILNADERSLSREEELFKQLVEAVLANAEELRVTAEALAEIDVFAGWARIAREWEYCQPELDESDELVIEQGRHPVVEQMMRRERHGLAGTHSFVPNDVELSSTEDQIALITGPNMAGKSTYIRQVALITLMAQVGSWVPAGYCKVGLVDRVFSRVGASDELARGNSTFMVEMNETANIINNATDRSLIILDEIGRGTSTYDGLSIAWAVVEHLHASKERGPRTLFATHYHELTQLESQLERVVNFCVAVKEWNDEIIFVRQVVRGAADRSYGIQVARLAGLPPTIIDRAKAILERLEADDSSHNIIRKRMHSNKQARQRGEDPKQMTLF